MDNLLQCFISTVRMNSSMKIAFYLFLVFLTLFPKAVLAVENPLERPNNKYGIHIVDENDLIKAARLVNSEGGDWGYVTIVIPEAERKVEKWNTIFDIMYELHLIPIVRLATNSQKGVWEKPKLEEVLPWADFLSELKWITKNRYVILFNEPNHAKEWGGDINPKEYAEIVSSFSATLKEKSTDFFILPAGFDASAPNANETMDEVKFLKSMLAAKPDVFSLIDGWVSHSYPNPGFRGSVEAEGRGTIANFVWELEMLKNLGIDKNLPVFITETGWPHSEGLVVNNNYLSSLETAEFIKKAAEKVWNHPNIVAVTPFILNYQSYPFIHFSWQKIGKEEFYPQYDAYRSLPKIAGNPLITETRLTPTPSNFDSAVLGETTTLVENKNNIGRLLGQILKPLSFLPFIGKYISAII